MKQQQTWRSGLTLTELLVVVAIIVIVTAVLAPLLTSTLDGREVREAARQVNAYLQQAQARAKELNRNVGVIITRTPYAGGTDWQPDLDLDFGYQLSLAEEPPPYTGFGGSTRARVHVNGFGNIVDIAENANSGFGVAEIWNEDLETFIKFVRPNDFIQFNYRGPEYRISRVYPKPGSNPVIPIVEFFTNGEQTLKYSRSNLQKFEVFRRPKAINSTPLELPVGAGIVLNLSGVGMGSGGFVGDEDDPDANGGDPPNSVRRKYIGLTEFQRIQPRPDYPQLANMPIILLFNPNGGVERVYRAIPTPGADNADVFKSRPPKRPQDKLYLFVGKQGLTRWQNMADGSNLWIAIDPRNGLITTAPNALTAEPPSLLSVALSRQLAVGGQSLGGQ